VISDPVAVFVVLAAVLYLAIRLEEHVAVFRSLGAALVAILFGMVLSNVGLLPGSSPTYAFLMGPGVNVGIALILLSVDIRSLLQAGPRMLAAFGIGAVGTAIGAVTAGLLLSPLVGPETWKLAGQLTGTYTGGGVNFAALGQALGTSGTMFAAATAADVSVTALWMAACLAVPVLLGRPKQVDPPEAREARPGPEEPATLERALHNSVRPVPLADAAAVVTIAVGAVWGAGELGSLMPAIPKVLWLTTIALVAAQFPAVKRLTGAALWGNYLVLLFLASNGARSVIANIVSVGPAIFYFASGTVLIHGLVIFGIGRLFRIDLATLAVASQANVGGAASAMAMASARGYADRVVPGVAVGLLGYAVGNYSGYAVAALMRSLLS
jgi:uncharacterized membrane protein